MTVGASQSAETVQGSISCGRTQRDGYPETRRLLSKGKAMALPGVAFSEAETFAGIK